MATTDLTAAETGYGFFFPTAGMVRRVPDGFEDLTVPGLPVEQIWFYRVMVDAPSTANQHILLNAYQPRLPIDKCDQIIAAIRAAFPSAIATCVIDDREGRAVVHPATGASEVAFAVALSKRSGGWDESDPIEVTGGGQSLFVSLSYREKVHLGRVETRAVQQ